MRIIWLFVLFGALLLASGSRVYIGSERFIENQSEKDISPVVIGLGDSKDIPVHEEDQSVEDEDNENDSNYNDTSGNAEVRKDQQQRSESSEKMQLFIPMDKISMMKEPGMQRLARQLTNFHKSQVFRANDALLDQAATEQAFAGVKNEDENAIAEERAIRRRKRVRRRNSKNRINRVQNNRHVANRRQNSRRRQSNQNSLRRHNTKHYNTSNKRRRKNQTARRSDKNRRSSPLRTSKRGSSTRKRKRNNKHKSSNKGKRQFTNRNSSNSNNRKMRKKKKQASDIANNDRKVVLEINANDDR